MWIGPFFVYSPGQSVVQECYGWIWQPLFPAAVVSIPSVAVISNGNGPVTTGSSRMPADDRVAGKFLEVASSDTD